MYFVYILQSLSQDDRFYLGFTSNLDKRLGQHNSGQNASTRGTSWRIVFYEAYLNERAARARERSLKRSGHGRRILMDRVRASL